MLAQQSIRINCSTEKVFEYLMDIENRKNYIPALEDVILLDPLPFKPGSRYIEVSTIAGRRLETTYQVVRQEKNRQITAKTLKSIFPIQVDLLLEPDKSATELIIKLDFELRGIFKLASGVVRNIVNQQAKEILQLIKSDVEASTI